MRMIWDGGHYQYGVNREDSLDSGADILAFLVRVMEMKPVRFAGR